MASQFAKQLTDAAVIEQSQHFPCRDEYCNSIPQDQCLRMINLEAVTIYQGDCE
jgi:hypothetical protein